jgi:dihydroflavonol-4-reductase
MRVFLTGGTGLVGSHAAESLVAAGHEVVALARPESDTRVLPGAARVVVGDLLDPPERLAGLMAGCDAIVHSAALVYRRGASWAEYERLNVTAVEQVLRAAGVAGAGRALLV